MMKPFLPIALIAVGSIVAAQHSGWEHFGSERYGYSASYPPGWHQFSSKNEDSLEIINFPDSQRRAGIVIPPWGADLAVGPSPYPDKSLEEWIQIDLRGEDATTDKTVANTAAGRDACSSFREIKYLENPDLSWTLFYCREAGRQFRISLAYSPQNREAKSLDAVALEVAKSIRFFPPGGRLR